MPFPDFINIDDADLTLGDSVNLLLASIAYQEFALANLINAEAEKIQYILGTLDGQVPLNPPATLDKILEVNHSADQTLRDIIKKEILLQLKLDKVLDVPTDNAAVAVTTSSSHTRPVTTTTATTTTTAAVPAKSTSSTTTSDPVVGGAWIVGTDYGTGCAQYTTLDLGELCKIVDLNLACQRVPVGKVKIVRCSNSLVVTISLDDPYFTDQMYLYVGNVPPVISNPEDFPFRFVVTDPADYFTAHTFTVDVSGFLGQTLYISAFANLLT